MSIANILHCVRIKRKKEEEEKDVKERESR